MALPRTVDINPVTRYLVGRGEQRQMEMLGQNQRRPRVQGIDRLGSGAGKGLRHYPAYREPLLNRRERDSDFRHNCGRAALVAGRQERPTVIADQSSANSSLFSGVAPLSIPDATSTPPASQTTLRDIASAESLPNRLELFALMGSSPRSNSAGERRDAIRASSFRRYCCIDKPAAAACWRSRP